MRIVLCSLVLALSAPAGAVAADQKPVKEKKICRESEAVSSRIAPKVCKTAAEWEAGSGSKAAPAEKQGKAAQ